MQNAEDKVKMQHRSVYFALGDVCYINTYKQAECSKDCFERMWT